MERQIKQYQAQIEKFHEMEQSATSKNDSISSRGAFSIPPSPSHSERRASNNFLLSSGNDDDYKTPTPSPGPPMTEYDIYQDLNDTKQNSNISAYVTEDNRYEMIRNYVKYQEEQEKQIEK